MTAPAAPITIETLEELIAMRDVLRMDKEAQRDQVIPAEVAADLEAIEAEFADKEALLAERIAAAEAALKAQAVAAGETIKGTMYDVRYNKGGYAVKAEDVLRVADRWEKVHPEVAAEIRSIITKKASFASLQPKRG